MIFTKPVPFAEALANRQAKLLLPNDLSASELGQIDAGIRERATALARVTNATFVQRASDLADAIVRGELTQDVARRKLAELKTAIGYEAPDGARGTMADLFSDQRLGLVLRMQVEQAFGYGQWRQGQSKPVLDRWPCQEFYRAAWRKEPRDWPARWSANGGEFYGGGGDYPEGRMIARKDSPIWEAISAFGLPYAPFDYNSGLDIRDVTREESVALGVIKAGEQVEPQERDFESDLGASVAGLDDELKERLLDDLGPEYTFDDGVLQRANETAVGQKNSALILGLSNANRIRRIGAAICS